MRGNIRLGEGGERMVRCIVTDLDRTLTGEDLIVDEAARERISDVRRLGIRVVIATGRRFDDPQLTDLRDHVDGLVAENGAVVSVSPYGAVEIMHAEFAGLARQALPDLAARFDWGRAIASGPRGLASAARERLFASGVAHGVEFNAEHVMLLPAGVNKATGADLCLRRMGLSPEDAWAIGDGENDAALLSWAAVGAAPANAVLQARAAADVLLVSAYARAFLELTEPILAGSSALAIPDPVPPWQGRVGAGSRRVEVQGSDVGAKPLNRHG